MAIYARVSTDRFQDETSTERQEADCRTLASLKPGWEVVDVYRDSGTSAYNLRAKRPEYDRLMADVAGRRVDVVLIWKLDRLARNTKEALRVKEHLTKFDADLVSVNDPGIDTTGPIGQFVFTIIAAVAQLESDQTSLRVKREKKAAAMAGRDPGGGLLPYGWEVEEVWRGDGTRRRKVKVLTGKVVPEQAENLKAVVTRFLDDGESLSSLCRWLNDERGARTNHGKRWRVQSLRNLLTSPRLAGYRQHALNEKRTDMRLYPAEWEAVIDYPTMERLQSRFGAQLVQDDEGLRLLRPGTGGARASTQQHLLTGLMWCGRCKGLERMNLATSSRPGVKPRYTCVGCVGTTIPQDVVEEHVTKEALLLLMGRRMLGHDQGVDVTGLTAQVEDVKERMRKLSLARFVDSVITEDEYGAARSALVEELATLEGQLTTADEMQALPIPGDVREGFDVWWEGASRAERRRVLDGAVAKVVIEPLTHELAAPFRKVGVEVTPDRDPQAGVPKKLRPQMIRGRIRIEWRPEVMPEPEPEPVI